MGSSDNKTSKFDIDYDRRPREVVIHENHTNAFGALETASIRSEVQIDAVYGLRAKTDTEVISATGGSVTAPNTGSGYEYKCSSGTSIGGYGIVRSRRAVSYRPGEGILMRWTARYGEPVALSAQRSGGIAVGVELSFGYDGTDFGLLYRTGGTLEIQTYSITTPASGSETVTVTLANTDYTVNVTSGTAAQNAYEIASDSQFAAGAGNAWIAWQNGDKVVFMAQSVGPKSGTFSISSTGALAGSFTQTKAGTAVTDDFIPQTEWNIDTMLGNGYSKMTLNPQKGNVYQIRYQYLGYGALTYYIEDEKSGKFVPVHRIQFANSNTSPSLTNPALKVGWFAASLGSTTNIDIYGASAMIGIEGDQQPRRLPDGQVNSKTGVGTTFTNILSVRTRRTFQDRVNLSEILPSKFNLAVDGTKISEYQIIVNADLGGTPNWAYQDEDNSVVEYDTASTTATLGVNSKLISAGVLGKTASDSDSLFNFDLHLIPGDTLTLAVRTTSGTTEAAASLTWLED